MEIRSVSRTEPFETLDGSLIHEFFHPRCSGARHQSLAHAFVAAGQSTLRHEHVQTEEIYYVLSGDGAMQIGGESERVGPGDAVLIPPGAEHRITCVGPEPLEILCLCSPPYTDEDTVVVEGRLV